MSNESLESGGELSKLKYRGNSIPWFIKVLWVVSIAFFIYYMMRFSWPDLKLWLHRP